MTNPFKLFNKIIVLLIFSCLILPTIVNARTSLYIQHNLVSDGSVAADHVDPHLVNPWGMAFGPVSSAWVANNGTGTATIYDGHGSPVPLVVTIPAAHPGMTGTPVGAVFNNTNKWVISSNGKSAPASFIFVTEDGTISAWSFEVDPSNAIIAVNNSSSGAVYKGLTIGANGKKILLYVTNFNAGTIETYDDQFQPVSLPEAFHDTTLPAGYAPFGIQNVNGDIYVTYGKQDSSKHDAVNGPGFGIVNAFDSNGKLLRRIATGGRLNAPWAIAVTPTSFGSVSNRLLVGNFGDGRINIFDLNKSRSYGQLQGLDGKPISIDGLWSLGFGNGVMDQSASALFFTAGLSGESHGLFGTIRPNER